MLGEFLAGACAAWLVAADPGHGRGGQGTLRGDLDVLQQEVRDVNSRLALAEAGWRIAAERAANAEAPGAAPGATAEQLRAVAADLKALRDALRGELQVVDARLADIRRRVDEANVSPAASAAARDAPPTQEDEDRWATLARDGDPGVRFSALSRLGRVRSERSVQVAIDRLGDESVEVVWQAVRNLGQFRERDAAAQVAPLLDHGDAVVRAAARDALVAMGAPKDTEFEATAPPEKRKAAADALKKWAETP